ncbi:MAG TPA: hypothetical protein VHD84_02720 [Candidatus Saccharimonadales bacterium]|nr:hypothetical protein [Candidatus Saccharimonadales bacterium]
MSVQETAPFGDYQPRPKLSAIEGGGESEPDNWMAGPESFRVQVFKDTRPTGPKEAIVTPDFYWTLNGVDRGTVDWNLVSGHDGQQEGVIDGIDSIPTTVQTGAGEIKVKKASWELITICMHHLNGDIRTINTPVGKMEFTEGHEVRLH